MALAEALWLDEVRPRIERSLSKPPALVMAVHRPITSLLSRATQVELVGGQHRLQFADESHAVVRMPDPAVIGADAIKHLMVQRGLNSSAR